jgi:hypothetical protein
MLQKDKFLRDENSRAVINTDIKGLNQYKAKKTHLNEMKNLKVDVDSLRDEMTEIKNLLISLVDKSR